jgi:hypothetical protein
MRSRCLVLVAGLVLALMTRADAAPDVIRVHRAAITVLYAGDTALLGRAGLLDWIRRSASIVSAYYGEFPTTPVTITITGVAGDRVMNGQTFGQPHARIGITVGSGVTASRLQGDWILVHEMIHLAAPQLDDSQNWLAEGLATYVEGIARVQAGNLSAADLWGEYVNDMPQGLPEPGDRGLDHTPTWARTYWGGALFCLVADVHIRDQTGNRFGLQDALRAVERDGGGMQALWSAERVFATGDRATGTRVLADLYGTMRDQPAAPDLVALWADLGILPGAKSARFDETARLAPVRRAITAPPAATIPLTRENQGR